MSNIFEGLNKISDEVIIGQVALLELIKNNFSIPILDKANRNVHRLTRFFNNIILNNSKENDIENQKIYDLLEQLKKENKGLSRLELVNKLIELIKQKVGFTNTDSPSLDAISIKVIDEAAVLFGIPILELPSIKADKVCELTYDYIVENTKKIQLEKHNRISKNLFNNTFRNFDESSRDKLVELLKLEEKIMVLPSYRKLRTNSEIDKEMLAIIVYISVMSLGGSLLNQSEISPKNNVSDEEVKYNKLVRKNNNSAFIKAANSKKIISLESLVNEKKLKNEKEINKNADSKSKISELSKLKLQLEKDLEIANKDVCLKEMELSKNFDELDQVKTMKYQKALFDSKQKEDELLTKMKTTTNSLIYQEKVFERTVIDIKKYDNEILDLQEKIKELQIENNSIENTKDDVLKKLAEEGKKRKARIIETWKHDFNNLIIDDNVYNRVVEFDNKELRYIELSLFELYNTNDILALKQGITNEKYNYMVVNSINRSPLKIIFEVISDDYNKGRIIGIEKVPLF